ncbi:MAG: DUF1919 domain-containing protein [Chitinophagaceae bacterium]|nr:MAG: DUF1919 domain-containing protein [Chitinophagaceae bacterium]
MSRVDLIKNKIKFRYNLALRKAYLTLNKKRLQGKKPFIISNNCWGGIVYQDLGLPYLSPFVNMYIFASCYLKILKNLNYYLQQPLTFTNVSKYDAANMKRSKRSYPIGQLDDVEIHFIHYTDEAYTLKKWNERVKRFNVDNLLVVMSERDGCTPGLIKEFDSLDYQNKVCFTKADYGLGSTVYFRSFKKLKEIPGADEIAGYTYWKLPLSNFLSGHTKS